MATLVVSGVFLYLHRSPLLARPSCVFMASASSSSARLLFNDSKSRLNQRVQYTVQGIASLTRNVVKSSKCSDLLTQQAKQFSQQEGLIETSELVKPWSLLSICIRFLFIHVSYIQTLRKMQVLLTQLGYQYDSMKTSSRALMDIKDQTDSMHQ